MVSINRSRSGFQEPTDFQGRAGIGEPSFISVTHRLVHLSFFLTLGIGVLGSSGCRQSQAQTLARTEARPATSQELDALMSEMPESRTFLLGLNPWAHAATPQAVFAALDFVEAKADLLYHNFTVNEGVPWPEALAGKPYHPNVEGLLSHLATRGAGQKVYLALSPMGEDRRSLAPYWGENKGMPLPSKWRNKTFDDPEVITAYTNYVRSMVERFSPDYLAYGVEVTGNFTKGDARTWSQFLTLASSVYSTIKAENPGLPIFATLQSTMGDSPLLFSLAREVLPFSDYVAVSTYPFLNLDGTAVDRARPESLPADWLSKWRALDPGKPFAISETCYPAQNLVAKSLGWNVQARELWQAEYLARLFTDCQALGAEWLVWFVPRDYDELWEFLKKQGQSEWGMTWRDTGLVDEAGRPRDSMKLWDAWRRLPHRSN